MELYNPESEAIVLSILLKNPNKYYDTGSLREEHFSSIQNRIIFRTIVELLSEGLTPDLSLVYDRLLKNGHQTSVDKKFLETLHRETYNEQNYKEYESNIVDSHLAKSLTSFSKEVETLIEKGSNVYSVAEMFSQRITDVLSSNSSATTKSNEELAPDYLENFNQRILNPDKRFITSGFSALDSLVGGVEPGSLWVIGGRTSMGKSALIINSMANCAKQGIPVLMFSKEMGWESLWDRMISIDTGISLRTIRGGIVGKSSPEYGKIEDAIERLSKYPIYIDQNFMGTTDYVVSTIRKFKHKHGIQLAYIDYLQLLAERNADSTHELGRITKALKLLAEELHIGIHLASQLNREVEYRDVKKPILSDLRQSGNIEEDADLVAFLYRDEYYNPESKDKGVIEYIIRKNRQGPIGTITMKFEQETTQIK